jgi:carbonic anhydrase
MTRQTRPVERQTEEASGSAATFCYQFDRRGLEGTQAAGLRQEEVREIPTTADAAARYLWKRNRLFAKFIVQCDPGGPQPEPVRIALSPREVGQGDKTADGFPAQEPFAAVFGCVDARAPVELLFAQGFDDLYSVRVAGNALGPEAAGSLHYALHSFAALKGTAPEKLPAKTLRLMVVLGHADCGAVTAAVKSLMSGEHVPEDPHETIRGSVREILKRIHFPAVAVALEALPEGSLRSHHRAAVVHLAALIELAVYLNAAWSAHEVQRLVEEYEYLAPDKAVGVRYGVFDPRDCYVRAGAAGYHFAAPEDPAPPPQKVDHCLAHPPADLDALRRLAVELAKKILDRGKTRKGMEHLACHYGIR